MKVNRRRNNTKASASPMSLNSNNDHLTPVQRSKNYFTVGQSLEDLRFPGIPIKRSIETTPQMRRAFARMIPKVRYDQELLFVVLMQTLDKLLSRGYLYFVRRNEHDAAIKRGIMLSLKTYPAVCSPYQKVRTPPSSVNRIFKIRLQHLRVLEDFMDPRAFGSFRMQRLLHLIDQVVSTREAYQFVGRAQMFSLFTRGFDDPELRKQASDFVASVASMAASQMAEDDNISESAAKIANDSIGNMISQTVSSIWGLLEPWYLKICFAIKRIFNYSIQAYCDCPLLVQLLLLIGLLIIGYYATAKLSKGLHMLVLAISQHFNIPNFEMPSFLNDLECAEAQSETSTAITLLSLAGYFVVGKKMDMREFTNITRMSRFSESFVEDVVDNIMELCRYVAYKITGDETFLQLNDLDDVEEAIKETGRIMMIPDLRSKLVRDRVIATRITNHFHTMTKLVPIVASFDRSKTLIVSAFHQQRLAITDLYMTCLSSSTLFTTRPEPVVLFFAGPPGHGKTTVGNALIDIAYTYMHKKFPEEFPKNLDEVALKYTKSQTSQFWERYAGHFATVHDEFLQSKVKEQVTNSLVDITQMVSSGAFALDMADLKAKGTAYYSSRMTLIMSNVSSMELEQIPISNPEAFFRRLHFPLEVIRGNTVASDASPTEFISGWKFKLIEHARKNPKLYTGTPRQLLENPATEWDVASVVSMLCETMHARQTEEPITSWTTADRCGALLEDLDLVARAQMWSTIRPVRVRDGTAAKTVNDLGQTCSYRGPPYTDAEMNDSIFDDIDPEPLLSSLADTFDECWSPVSDAVENAIDIFSKDLDFHVAKFNNQFAQFNAGDRTCEFRMASYARQLRAMLAREKVKHRIKACVVMRQLVLTQLQKTAQWSALAGQVRDRILVSGDWRHAYTTGIMCNVIFAQFFNEDMIYILEYADSCEAISTEYKPNLFYRSDELDIKIRLGSAVSHGYLSEEHVDNLLMKDPCLYSYDDSIWRSVKDASSYAWESLGKLLSMPFKGFSLEHGISDGWDFDSPDPMTIAAVTSAVAAFGLGVYGIVSAFSSGDNCHVAQSDYRKNPSYLRGMRKKQRHMNRGVIQRRAAVAQASTRVSNVANKVARNVFTAEFVFGHMRSRSKLTFITGRTAVTAGHTAQVLGTLREITILMHKSQGGSTSYTSDDFILKFDSRRDLVFITFSDSLPMKTDLTKMLVSRNDFLDLDIVSCTRLHTWSESKKMRQLQTCGEVSSIETPFKSSVFANGTTEYIEYDQFYAVYDGRGETGDCGLPYVSDENNPKILGVHIASFNSDGIVAPVFIEDFGMHDVADAQCVVIPSYLPKPEGVGRYREGVVPLGTLDKPLGGRARNDLVPTKLNGHEFSVKYKHPIYDLAVEPARVSPEPGWEPWTKADKCYVRTDTPSMPSKMHDMMLTTPRTLWVGFTHVIEPDKYTKKLSFEVGTYGLPGEINHMDGSSSPGMYGLYHGLKRSDYYNLLEKTAHEKYRARIAELEWLGEHGYIPCMDGVENLKVELRTIGKFPRLFCGIGVEHCTWTKMVMGDLISHLKKHNWCSSCMVGINPHSLEWDVLGRKVLKEGWNRIGGDFSGCDTTVPSYAPRLLFLFAQSWYRYTPHSPKWVELKCCCYSIVQMYRVRGREAFLLNRGHASGHYLTSFYNSFWNYVMLRYIFIVMYPNASEQDFLANVNIAVYGDDMIGCVHPNYPDFNMINIGKIINEQFGMIYTMPDKTEIDQPYLNDWEPEFLSRGFRKVAGIYRAPLCKDSIYGMLLYVHESKIATVDEQLSTNLTTAEMEMFHYGPEEFRAFQHEMIEHCRNREVPYSPRPYSYYEARYVSQGDDERASGLNEFDLF